MFYFCWFSFITTHILFLSVLFLRNIFETIFEVLYVFIINFMNKICFFQSLIDIVSHIFINILIFTNYFRLQKFIIFWYSMMSFRLISLILLIRSSSTLIWNLVKLVFIMLLHLFRIHIYLIIMILINVLNLLISIVFRHSMMSFRFVSLILLKRSSSTLIRYLIKSIFIVFFVHILSFILILSLNTWLHKLVVLWHSMMSIRFVSCFLLKWSFPFLTRNLIE